MIAGQIEWKQVAKLLALNLLLFGLVAFWIVQGYHQRSTQTEVSNIASKLEIGKQWARIDSSRHVGMTKITGIINRYNNEMPTDLRQQIAEEIYRMSQKYPNLNIDFILATITHESAKTWEPTVTSYVGAMGLMQIMPSTGAYLAVKEGVEWTSAEDILYDPILNIRLGCRYLHDLVQVYQHDGGLAAYNGGPKRAEMWIESNRNNNILFAETRDYVPAILKLYAEFQNLEVM